MFLYSFKSNIALLQNALATIKPITYNNNNASTSLKKPGSVPNPYADAAPGGEASAAAGATASIPPSTP